MKKFILLLLVIITFTTEALCFVPQPTPDIYGSTGVLVIPSADVIPYKNFNFGIDFGPLAFTDKWTMLYKMTLGTFQGMELGCEGSDDGNGSIREGVLINLKYSLVTDTSAYPLLFAMGVEGLTSKTSSSVYMMATRYLQNGSRLHFGFLGNFIDVPDVSSKFIPLGALGYDSPISERLYGLIDMMAGEHVFQLDLGVRWYVSESVAFNLSGINVLAAKDTPRDNYRDPKSVMVGMSWINPL
jgi:hypothetical protein